MKLEEKKLLLGMIHMIYQLSRRCVNQQSMMAKGRIYDRPLYTLQWQSSIYSSTKSHSLCEKKW